MGEIRTRRQKTIQFEANAKVTEDLSRGMVYRYLMLRLQGAATSTAGNNAQANLGQGDEWALLKRIDIIANNTDVIKSIDGNALWWLNYFLFGTPPQITSNLGDGATANPAWDSVLILPFAMPRSVRPVEYALDARQLSSLTIDVTWGQYTDVNSAASAWTTEPTLEVSSVEQALIKGPFNQWRSTRIEQVIAATNSAFQIKLPVGPMYRSFLMNFTDAGIDDFAILNNMKLKAGSTVYADLGDEVIRQSANIVRNLSRLHTNGAAVDYLALRRGTTDNNVLGWYYYDHVVDGYNSDAIDTLGFSEFELELDVTIGGGATKAIIYPQSIIPIRSAR